MIRAGEDVKIVDNNSKEDLTAITLTQIIFEEEKKGSFLPLSALRNIIQSGGDSISSIASSAGEKVRAVFRRGDKEEDQEGSGEPEGHGGQVETHSPGAIRDFLERSQQTFDDWQKRVDERVRHAVESLSPLASVEKELRALSQRLSDLERRIEDSE
jgi:polyhydroxyalkanoate synthesis regulator protein